MHTVQNTCTAVVKICSFLSCTESTYFRSIFLVLMLYSATRRGTEQEKYRTEDHTDSRAGGEGNPGKGTSKDRRHDCSRREQDGDDCSIVSLTSPLAVPPKRCCVVGSQSSSVWCHVNCCPSFVVVPVAWSVSRGPPVSSLCFRSLSSLSSSFLFLSLSFVVVRSLIPFDRGRSSVSRLGAFFP